MIELNTEEIKLRMSKAIASFKKDLSSLRVGRASSSMLDQINVNAYGSTMPLNQISTISVPEARLLLVSVWDNSLVSITEKSIRESPLSSLRVGRASSSMLDQISINAYGNTMPLNQISTISVPEARLLLVSVWDNSLVSITEKTIRESPLGFNPMVEGNVIRISIPALSEDRRIEITKVAGKYAENAKIAVRNIRRDNVENVRKLQKNSDISEDQKHQDELLIQEITNDIIVCIDNILSNKEKEILEN
jgi:ribosome recycling factor